MKEHKSNNMLYDVGKIVKIQACKIYLESKTDYQMVTQCVFVQENESTHRKHSIFLLS